MTQSPNHFLVFQTRTGIPEGAPGKLLWEFRMSREPEPDLPVDPQDAERYNHVPGRHKWADGDRIGYGSAWAVWMHSDTHHDFTPAIRLQWQDYGGTNRINDQYMRENPFDPNAQGEKQGLAPYPYERVRPAPVDKSRPGGVIEVFHLRTREPQMLGRITIPAQEPKNPKTRWYYQLNGLFVAVNADLATPDNPDGVIAKLIVSGLQGADVVTGGPAAAYTYRIQGVRTSLGQ